MSEEGLPLVVLPSGAKISATILLRCGTGFMQGSDVKAYMRLAPQDKAYFVKEWLVEEPEEIF